MRKFVKSDLVAYNQKARYFIENMNRLAGAVNVPQTSIDAVFVVIEDNNDGNVWVSDGTSLSKLYSEDLEIVCRVAQV